MGGDESQFEILKKLELPLTVFKELFDYCDEKNILFMSTPFDEESVDILDDLGMQIIKIPSGEITNKPLIQHIAAKKKPIILSTGMSYLGEVEKAINWINEIWDKRIKQLDNPLTILHCVSNYPAAIEDINLLAMKTLEKAFKLPVGYSDHTQGIEVPIAAVALGARVIEKHFTLDRNMEGPDHMSSIEPDELETMIKGIKNIEKALGDGIKKPTKNEEGTRNLARRSLVAARGIKTGEVFTKENITVKRPGTGMSPVELDKIMGLKAKRDFKEDELIEKD